MQQTTRHYSFQWVLHWSLGRHLVSTRLSVGALLVAQQTVSQCSNCSRCCIFLSADIYSVLLPQLHHWQFVECQVQEHSWSHVVNEGGLPVGLLYVLCLRILNGESQRDEVWGMYGPLFFVLLSDSTCMKNTAPPRNVQTEMSGYASSARENNLQIY